jgi:hypothetical protein
VIRAATQRSASLCSARRAASSMTAESQQKVCRHRSLAIGAMLTSTATLRRPRTCRSNRLGYSSTCNSSYSSTRLDSDSGVGETKTEALHQSYSLRKLHITSRSRCSWKCYAKYAPERRFIESSLTPYRQILGRISRRKILWWKRVH